MKASTFIKVALLDQMQQIADLGLWFHVAKLLPSGVEVLARVAERNENSGFLWSEKNPENLAIPDYIVSITAEFYGKFFPPEYRDRAIQHGGAGMFSAIPRIWLVSDTEGAEKHLRLIGEKEHMVQQPCYLHVPTWFADFKKACQIVLDEIESGKIQDIEVLKTIDE